MKILSKLLTPVLVTNLVLLSGARPAAVDCESVSVSVRGQHLQIKHNGCTWIRVEYSTTDWRCRGSNCEQTGTVTWHDLKIDTRGKERNFYHLVASGPKNVSKVEEASVLDCSCN